MACFGYIRVSKRESQQADGDSLPVQRRQLHGWALTAGRHISKIFADAGVSGAIALADRPAGGQLLQKLRPGDIVVVSKLDRAFRSAADALQTLERCESNQIDLVLMDLGTTPVTKSGISKLLFTILSAFASFERERIAERIRDQKRDARERRVFTGARPFGYRVIQEPGQREKYLVPDPTEQSIIREIPRLRAAGLSYHAIAAAIRARGINISHMTVKRVLIGLIRGE